MDRGGSIALVCVGLCACIARDELRCIDDAQCSLHADGVCLAGGCAYPDESCASGLRYSELAGRHAGDCVEDEIAEGSTGPGNATTTATATTVDDPTTGGATTGTPAGPCEDVDCSGAGACVVLDGAPTCACEPGYWVVDLSCVADPCDDAPCWYVDDVAGDDAAAGTLDAPWRTLSRLYAALATAQPGDHFLLRRGGTWGDPAGGHRLEFQGVHGSEAAPIVVGAYGPLADGRPRIQPGNVRVGDSSHVVIRDLHVQDDPADAELTALYGNRPCILVERSDHVTIVDNELTACVARGIFAWDGASYLAIVDNVVHDVGNSGISIIDATWEDPVVRVGHHHWVLDNRVFDSDGSGIDAFVGAPDAPIGDVKIARNRVSDTVEGIVAASSGFAWVVDNLVGRAQGTESWQASLRLSTAGGGQLSGNLAFETGVGGIVVDRTVSAVANTVIHDGTLGDALGLDDAAAASASRNLLWARGGRRSVAVWSGTAAEHVVAFDRQWYVGADAAACTFADAGSTVDLAAWVAATGQDVDSQCGSVPGFGDFEPGVPSDAWDAAFLAAFTPAADWSACDDPIGARDCEGNPVGPAPQPLDGYDESGGLGWAGPLVVRQRYDLAP